MCLSLIDLFIVGLALDIMGAYLVARNDESPLPLREQTVGWPGCCSDPPALLPQDAPIADS